MINEVAANRFVEAGIQQRKNDSFDWRDESPS